MPYFKLGEGTEDKNPVRPLLMIFSEGTVLGPEHFWQLYDHAAYVPIGRCVGKVGSWQKQGAEIVYFTSRRTEKQVREIQNLLLRYHFPGKYLYFRAKGQGYRDIVEQVVPDVLIEDDCRSIGGQWQMCITYVKPEIRRSIRSAVVREFRGIDGLPKNLAELLARDSGS